MPSIDRTRQQLDVLRQNILSVASMIQEHEDYLVDHYSVDDVHYADLMRMANHGWELFNEFEETISCK